MPSEATYNEGNDRLMKSTAGLLRIALFGLNQCAFTQTMSEANKYAAGVWKRAHAPQTALRMAARFFAWRLS
jgi:hypothetical protein